MTMREPYPIEVIEEKLSYLQKLNYNRFFWWRRWTRKGKPLHKYSPLMDKIKNGDYDDSPTADDVCVRIMKNMNEKIWSNCAKISLTHFV